MRNAATVAQKWHATVADHPALTYFLDQSENSMRALPGRVVSPAAYKEFEGTSAHDALSERERTDLRRLWKGYAGKQAGPRM